MSKSGASFCCAVLAAVLAYLYPELFFDDALPPVPLVSKVPPGPEKEPVPWNTTKPLFESSGPYNEDNPVNLFAEGLTERLGGAFSFMATYQMDDVNEFSRIFDFSLYPNWESVSAGNFYKSCDLVFTSMEKDNAAEIYLPDFFKVGKEATALFTISATGRMSVYRESVLLGENVGGYPLSYVERPHLVVGNHHSKTHQGFRGTIRDIKVWNQEVTWPEDKSARGGKGRR